MGNGFVLAQHYWKEAASREITIKGRNDTVIPHPTCRLEDVISVCVGQKGTAWTSYRKNRVTWKQMLLESPHPCHSNIYMCGHKTFIQCLGSWWCQLLQQLSKWLPTFIHLYLYFSALSNSVLIYLYSLTNCELCWAKQLCKRGYCTWNETRFVKKVCYHMTHMLYVFHCIIFT